MEQNKRMTDEELKAFLSEKDYNALMRAREMEAKAQAQAKHEADILAYKQLVDDAVNATVPDAKTLNETISVIKRGIIDRFQSVIAMKNDLFAGTKRGAIEGRFTDTFTSSDGNSRVTIGWNTNDRYDDTYTAGVEMVQEYINGLAKDAESRQLADMVNTLLAERSKLGQLKAQNVLRLEKMASESKNEKFIEGMRIIRDAYRPERTKMFVQVSVRDSMGKFNPISLNMTDCDL